MPDFNKKRKLRHQCRQKRERPACPKSLIMDSRVKDCFGWDLKTCGSRKNCFGWQEAIATLSVQLDHGKLTPQNKSPGPKICSCNLLMDWVLHLVVCCTGAADQGKLVQNTRICMWSVNKLCSTASAKPIWLWKTTQLYLMATIGKKKSLICLGYKQI